jgi:allantoicase
MHNGVIMHLIVVDDGGLIIDGLDTGRRQAVMADVVIAEVTKRDESEGVEAEAKAETRPHADTIEPPAQP